MTARIYNCQSFVAKLLPVVLYGYMRLQKEWQYLMPLFSKCNRLFLGKGLTKKYFLCAVIELRNELRRWRQDRSGHGGEPWSSSTNPGNQNLQACHLLCTALASCCRKLTTCLGLSPTSQWVQCASTPSPTYFDQIILLIAGKRHIHARQTSGFDNNDARLWICNFSSGCIKIPDVRVSDM